MHQKLDMNLKDVNLKAFEQDKKIDLLTKKFSVLRERESNLQEKFESLLVKFDEMSVTMKANRKEETPGKEIKCEECDFKTNLNTDLEKHIIDQHSLVCDYCDFVAKSLTGLKIHIRRMHSNSKKLISCNFCTFTAKTETEVKTHTSKWNITHSSIFNDNHEEINYEMFALKEIGLVLLGFQNYDNDWWSRWMERSFQTLGKNPR